MASKQKKRSNKPNPIVKPAPETSGPSAPETASDHQQLPRVSLCTVTYNRSAFLPLLQQHILAQTYPRERLEWIILDDSEDPSQSFQLDHSQGLTIRYHRLPAKVTLGKKRNLSHALCSGDIIIYMDDDDYYPPTRVSHAVDTLLRNDALIAGSTILPILFLPENEIWIAGPYGKNHATAGTFAFKRELLSQTSHDETRHFAEEKSFLKDYTIPMAQLDPNQTILCIAHNANTFEKRKLKHGGNNPRFNQLQAGKVQALLAGIKATIRQYEAVLASRSKKQGTNLHPLTSTPDSQPFLHIVVPLYNQEKYIERCLESIGRQQGCHFSVTVVDDASSDNSFEIAKQFAQHDTRFNVYKSICNGGPLHNLVRCINACNAAADDVIVCIDGDDQLMGNDSLAIIAEAYKTTHCWITYGSFITSRGERRGGTYDRRTIRDNLFRVAPWYASHLKTFRMSLWSQLSDTDLRDNDGHYFQGALDLAFMLPMLELAGEKQTYIPDIVYLWNVDNSESISMKKKELQHRDAHTIRNRRRYSPLTA